MARLNWPTRGSGRAVSDSGPPSGRAHYLAVLAIETVGAVVLVWSGLPVFRQLATNPGHQPAKDSLHLPVMLMAVLIMQASYWYRLRCVPIPPAGPNAAFNHLFVFLARLSFVFGSGLFSLALFRHLPELDSDSDLALLLGRGAVLMIALFALFCFSLEVERLGSSFER